MVVNKCMFDVLKSRLLRVSEFKSFENVQEKDHDTGRKQKDCEHTRIRLRQMI